MSSTLATGASFQIGGHSVSAQVRGTQFEILVRNDNTNLIKVFDGTVRVSGKTTATLTAGQQIDADANGTLANQRAIQPEPKDPYALSAQCTRAVSSGTTAGTAQTSTGDNLATGQTATVDYHSPGGTISVALCYPGSLMTLTLVDPNGVQHTSRQGGTTIQFNISGPPGLYKAIVHGVNAPAGGEAYSLAFASNTPCGGDAIESSGFVRQTLSNDQISQGLQRRRRHPPGPGNVFQLGAPLLLLRPGRCAHLVDCPLLRSLAKPRHRADPGDCARLQSHHAGRIEAVIGDRPIDDISNRFHRRPRVLLPRHWRGRDGHRRTPVKI